MGGVGVADVGGRILKGACRAGLVLVWGISFERIGRIGNDRGALDSIGLFRSARVGSRQSMQLMISVTWRFDFSRPRELLEGLFLS